MPKETDTALISHVEIENFKAVESASLDLKQLTVVVGPNSSGKSTFIQAILLVVQHLRDEFSTELNYSLNEDLVQLGSFSETVLRTPTKQANYTRTKLSFGSSRTALPTQIDWDVTLERDDSDLSRFARTKTLNIRRYVSDLLDLNESGDPKQINADWSNSYDYDLKIEFARSNEKVLGGELESIPISADRSSVREVSAVETVSNVASNVRYLLFEPGELPQPLRRVKFSDIVAAHAQNTWDRSQSLLKLVSSLTEKENGNSSDDKKSESLVPEGPKRKTLKVFENDLAIALKNSLEKSDEWQLLKRVDQDGVQENPYRGMDEDLKVLNDYIRKVTVRITDEHEKKLLQVRVTSEDVLTAAKTAAVQSVKTSDFDVLAPINDSLTRSVFERRERLGLGSILSRVYYIGPIRDIDREVNGRSTRRSLGIHGEFCAAVLQRELKEKISNPPYPPKFSDFDSANTFSEILNIWMQHLELASAVEVEDRGRYKAGIKIVPRRGAEKTVSVNSVGVGVAQVLPIIMQCLLAEPESSITIIEQPELHLHPSIEIKLADFFLACAKTGRQIFIETHSEHLINRLRLEIASDSSYETRGLVSVLFAKQDEETGVTSYENAIINHLGGIEGGWPDNFLDLSTEQSLELLETAVRRRRADQYADFDDDDEDF